jgi:murein DD-endopeptidase MepM/ murein hydrolase activator NlpD
MSDPNHMGFKEFTLPIENGEVLKGLKNFGEKLIEKYSFKKVLMGLMLIVIAGLLLTTYKINEIRTRAFVMYFGDDEIGIVRKQEEALNILNDIKKELTNTYDIDVVFSKDISFKDTHVKDNLLVSPEELKESITSKMTFLVSGYVLLVDNKEIGATKTKKEAEEVIEKIKAPYLEGSKENREIEKVEFVENVKIEKRNVPLNKIMDKDELFEYARTGAEEIKTHIVEVGESLWTIAKIYDMTVEDLIEANSDKNPEKLQIGDEVKLLVPKPMMTVATVEKVKYTEKINHEIKVEYDKNMYKTEKKIKVKGSEGENEIIAKVTKHNGVIIEKEILEEKVIQEPVDELVVKGTKEVPKTMATGIFLMPTRGSVSSRYGMRNGRMHKGLDIAARTGTAIKAADGGKVVYTGRRGAYGNLVEIDHGNGYRTRYAHCSTINVKVGERVYKGQVIAKVGNTGRSTGSHLHFEVLKNGRNQNPASYVK